MTVRGSEEDGRTPVARSTLIDDPSPAIASPRHVTTTRAGLSLSTTNNSPSDGPIQINNHSTPSRRKTSSTANPYLNHASHSPFHSPLGRSLHLSNRRPPILAPHIDRP